jgi:heavy metal sensor kinase
MTLTTRLSLFFLGALALVLAGFSTTLYLLARTHLQRQVEDRLEAALDTLMAAVEIDPDGLKWEPRERQLTLGQESRPDAVRWLVEDEHGEPVDRSPNLAGADLWTGWPTPAEPGLPPAQTGDSPDHSWLLGQRRMPAPEFRKLATPEPGERAYRILILKAAVSFQPMQTTLGGLAFWLVSLSVGIWLLAAGVGRWLCRRALGPVTRMAETARAMGPADLEERLPVASTGDELEDLGRAFNDLLARRHEAFERQQRFAGDASHQLRTPLTAMLGQVEVALRRDRTAEEYRQVLELVKRQAVHMRQIVEMLLFLARADAEAKLPLLDDIDLASWLPAHLQTWSDHERGEDLRLHQAAGGPYVVAAQAPLLGQLVDNLVDNACKHSPPHTPIGVQLTAEAGFVTLTVEDQGDGIPAEDLPHIFEPFYRSARDRRRGRAGVGLGLAVAQRIATAFGGSVGVQSHDGKGSRFTVRLPRADRKSDKSAVEVPPPDGLQKTA